MCYTDNDDLRDDLQFCNYGKFYLWKIPPMENSIYVKFHPWKISPTENLGTKITITEKS